MAMVSVLWRSATCIQARSATRLFGTKCSRTAENNMIRKKKSVLVDGNNVLYHFYDPNCPLERNGMKIGAVERVLRLLERMDKTHQPEHICVFFDTARRPTTRKLMDPSYKSDRKPTPSSLRPQLASAAKILSKVHINCITVPGFEADDLIASYTDAYAASGYDVLIISNDNDFLQLTRGCEKTESATLPENDKHSCTANETGIVELYQPNKRRYIKERHVQSRFGLRAHLIPDFHALCGTKWGKINRVAHMTDESAVELLTQYGGLFKLLRSLDAIEDPLLRKSLKHGISSIETSYRIAKLNTQIALPLAITDFQLPQLDKVASLIVDLNTDKTDSQGSVAP